MICVFNFPCPFTLLLNICDGNDAFWRHSVLVKQSSSLSKKHWTFSPDLCPPNSPVDYGICGLMQERVHIVQPPVRDTSRCDQRLQAAPHWHMGKHDKTSSTKQLFNGWSGYMQAWRQITSLWTTAKLKPALFRANTLHNRLFSEPPTVYRGKHVVSRNFHRSYLQVALLSQKGRTMLRVCH